MQTSTQSAVRAIGSITSRMEEIRLFTSAIATSVEQQHAATNVAAAATGTRSVVGVLQQVSTAIADMHSSADTVLTASSAVKKASDSLRQSVDGFLSKVAL